MEVKGTLVLHHVSTEVRNPIGQTLVQLVADMNGKDVSKIVRLAEDAEIHFQVRDGRLHHEGLRIGFPDIDPELQITSHGSVGLDKTLDLFVELPRLDQSTTTRKRPGQMPYHRDHRQSESRRRRWFFRTCACPIAKNRSSRPTA